MIDVQPVNIAAHLSAMARSRPDEVALICPSGQDGAGRTLYVDWTFRRLDRESDALARGLTRIGIGPGVRTVLMVKPSLEFFALTFALFKAGAVPVLIDPGMGVRNIGRCLADVDPGAFIGIAKAQAARQVLGWGRPSVQRVVTVHRRAPWCRVPASGPADGASLAARSIAIGPCWPFEGIGLDRVRAAGWSDEPFPIAPVRERATDAILFTSGSTGPPKGAVYSHANFGAQVEMLRSLYAIEPGEIDLCTFPLFALFAPALGMTAVIPEMDATRPARVDPVKIIEPIKGFGVTNLFGSPALIDRVARYGVERGVRLPTLRRVISAGAPVPARVLERFATLLDSTAQIFTPYGATEALPVCSIGSREVLGETRRATDRGAGVCVGRPVDGIRLEIIAITDDPIPSWSDDLILPDGDIGEIVVMGPNVTRGYCRRPEANALAKIRVSDEANDGFFHRMGDLGYRDERGRIWFCGRKAHRVVTRTQRLFTIPCEAVFNTHPDVARTALVGVGTPPDVRPVLCVELARPLNRDECARVRRGLLEIGAGHEHTREITTFLFHKRFPVDIRHNAKIFREALAAWAAKRLA